MTYRSGRSGASVLVCYASRYGSTREIAECISEELRGMGIHVDCMPAGRDIDPGDYDAVVLGSPIYMGKWLAEARELVSRERTALGQIPVAVFSVGYSFRDHSDQALQSGDAALSDVRLYIIPRESAFFPGRVSHSVVSSADRAILILAKVAEGDFRDMDLVRSWARTLPGTLGITCGK